MTMHMLRFWRVQLSILCLLLGSRAVAEEASTNSTGTLSREELAALGQAFTNQETGVIVAGRALFGPENVADAEKRKGYEQSGRVPYRLGFFVYEYKPVEGEPRPVVLLFSGNVGITGKATITNLTDGRVEFYVQDSDGKIVDRGAQDLGRMRGS